MDMGSGWLVTQSGAWVPVSYNASVDKSMGWARSQFTSLSGYRRTASRGRTPRTWDVTEKMVAEWSQILETVWQSDDSSRELFWVPPMEALSNYAKPIVNQDGELPGLQVSDSGVDAGASLHSSYSTFLTDLTPLNPKIEIEFGAKVTGGDVLLYIYDAGKNFVQSVTASSVADANGFLKGRFKPSSANHVYGRLVVAKTATQVATPFIRFAVDVWNGRPGGSGGCWVTLDDLNIGHKAIGVNSIIVETGFTVTECELN